MSVQDDKSIGDDEILLRRIPPKWFKRDAGGTLDVSSQAFQNLEGEMMSVHLQSIMEASGLAPTSVLEQSPGYGLVSFSAGHAREADQVIVKDPLPGDPSHAHVVGAKGKGWRKRFKRGCTVIVYPHG